MQHLEQVNVTGDVHGAEQSHWVAKAPLGRTVEWDAEISEEKPNEIIAWRSLPGSEMDNSGMVQFMDAPGGRGTEIKGLIK